jgi:hypothetical protein
MPIAKLTTFNVAHRSLHFPRDGTRQHHIIIIIIVLASIGGVLITLLFWRLLARSLSSRSRSAPLPPRQALVYQRERQLAAFTGHQSVSVPRKFLENLPSSPVRHRHGGNASLIPPVENSSANNSYRVSLYTHETDDGIEGLSTSHGNPLHPPMPHFFPPHLPLNASSTSHSSEPTSLAATSTSASRQSLRTNTNPRSRSRAYSVVSSNGTSRTGTTARSRSSIRGAPHAPHNNVQIVLPAPLAPNLYQQSPESDTAYGDNWRSSLADKWIPVGQQPEPKYVKRQASHDSLDRRGRQAQKGASLGHRRSNSNPLPFHPRHFPKRSLDNSLSDAPPVPRVPSVYVPRQDTPVLLAAEPTPDPRRRS